MSFTDEPTIAPGIARQTNRPRWHAHSMTASTGKPLATALLEGVGCLIHDEETMRRLLIGVLTSTLGPGAGVHGGNRSPEPEHLNQLMSVNDAYVDRCAVSFADPEKNRYPSSLTGNPSALSISPHHRSPEDPSRLSPGTTILERPDRLISPLNRVYCCVNGIQRCSDCATKHILFRELILDVGLCVSNCRSAIVQRIARTWAIIVCNSARVFTI
jgi:hypothetical protein